MARAAKGRGLLGAQAHRKRGSAWPSLDPVIGTQEGIMAGAMAIRIGLGAAGEIGGKLAGLSVPGAVLGVP